MKKCIAFHSYKGGTGKTTLAANFAALLAKKGYKVFLLDFDVYSPSLQSYFEIDPKKWINDFLFEKAELEEVLMDLTPLIEGGEGSGKSTGGLWINEQLTETDMHNFLMNETGMKVLSTFPCYSDIQFRKEFLTLLNQPEHHFAKGFEESGQAVETI